ncbi:hypothetical protein [Nocardia sp. IFM 10818]
MASAADERHILDQLRRLQDHFSRGEADQANAGLKALFDQYGRSEVERVRHIQAADQFHAEVELFALLGPRALYGDN